MQTRNLRQNELYQTCLAIRFPNDIIANTKTEIPKQAGNMNLLLTIEEIQELLIEMQKINNNHPDADNDYLTEEFTDCLIMLDYLSVSEQIPFPQMFDIDASGEHGLIYNPHSQHQDISYVTQNLLEISKTFSKAIRNTLPKEKLIHTTQTFAACLMSIHMHYDIRSEDITKWAIRKQRKTRIRNQQRKDDIQHATNTPL